MSVSSDHAFPLFQQAYSGNTADVTTYVEQWQRLIDLIGRRDFLYVADSKLITHQTMAHIHDNDGYFVAPAPMYESYKSEHTFRRAKGPYSIEPVYLHTPERIEAFLLLFKIALQMVVLIERTTRKNIRERDYGIDNFMPNRVDVRNPRSEYMLKEFEDIVKGELPLPDGNT